MFSLNLKNLLHQETQIFEKINSEKWYKNYDTVENFLRNKVV